MLAAILVPQGMAYTELAGLPAVTGLYTTIGCLVGYALFGPSRVLVLGPDSSVSPLIFAAIVPLMATNDPKTAIALAGMLALIVGLIEIGLGVGKLGFVADLLSSEVQVGYMNGLAITIIVGQLPKLFGFSTDASGFVGELRAFFDNLDKTEGVAFAVGIGVLVILLGLPRLTRTVPAVLVAVVAATAVSAAFGLSDQIATVGSLPHGVPRPSIPWTDLSDVGPLLIAAIGITLVSLTDTIATSSAFAARRGDEVDPNQEMIGIGAANIAAGFVQGFAVSTSGSRTAVAEQSGAKSQLTGVVGAGVVVVLLLFLNNLLADLPQAALAAVVIAAALSLLNLGALRRYWSVRPSAVVLSLVASLGVIFFGVLQGIVIAIFSRSCCSSAGVGGRMVRCSAKSRASTGGTAWTCTTAPAKPPASSYTDGRRRCSSRTQARSVARSATLCASGARDGSSCSAKPSPMSTSLPGRRSSSSTRN